MLKIHQPYIKKKYRYKYTFALASIGVLLLACGLVLGFSPATHLNSRVYAAGDSRTLSDISAMQEMTQQICSNSEYLETNTLKDTRDVNSYSVVKLEDENCWMQQNLKLGGSSTITLTPSDSDVTSNYALPASSNNSWITSETTGNGQIRVGRSGMTISSSPGDGKGWQSNYGNYYSWCAATAGTCSESTSDNVNVSGSICPKGWHLPSGGSASATGTNVGQDSEFYKLLNGFNMSTITTSPYLFPAAGFISSDGLGVSGTSGFYWSSTAYSNTYAYRLALTNNGFYPGTSNNLRYFGFSVRCVAAGGLPKIEKPLFTEDKDGNVNVNVPSTLTIDATSGMAENADSSKITEGTATATVSSNIDYTVTLHSTQPALKDTSVTTAELSPVSNNNPVEPGNNSWGFWNNKSNPDDSKIYDTPITTEPQEFYNTTTSSVTNNGNTTTHTYYVGISIAPSLPSGTYSTDVIITAATK